MKIEVWADFICPYSYMGKRRLEKALEQFPHHKNVFIEYKSYQLDPRAGQHVEESVYELLSSIYNISIEEAEISAMNIVKQAAELGLIYDIERVQRTNTFDAHRLTQYARLHNKGNEMSERLFKACFTESKHIGDHHILIELAREVGLDLEEVETLLTSCKFTKNVHFDQEQAIEVDVQQTPFFVFNEKYAVPGAQPSKVLLEVLEHVWQEENEEEIQQEFQPKQAGATYCCEGESCAQEEVEIK